MLCKAEAEYVSSSYPTWCARTGRQVHDKIGEPRAESRERGSRCGGAVCVHWTLITNQGGEKKKRNLFAQTQTQSQSQSQSQWMIITAQRRAGAALSSRCEDKSLVKNSEGAFWRTWSLR